MTTCLAAGALVLALASPVFTLEWQHSVEKTGWRETWAVEDGALHLREAAVRGSGAGMEPGQGARLLDGWWVWAPDLPPQPRLTLAASGATGGGWTLCADGTCHALPESGAPLVLKPCGGGDGGG